MDEKMKETLDRVRYRIDHGWYSIAANDDEWKAILSLLFEKEKVIENLQLEIAQCREVNSLNIADLNQEIYQLENGIIKYKEVVDKLIGRIKELEEKEKEIEELEKARHEDAGVISMFKEEKYDACKRVIELEDQLSHIKRKYDILG